MHLKCCHAKSCIDCLSKKKKERRRKSEEIKTRADKNVQKQDAIKPLTDIYISLQVENPLGSGRGQGVKRFGRCADLRKMDEKTPGAGRPEGKLESAAS